MQYSILAGAVALALLSPLAGADTTTSETSTYSSTAVVGPTPSAYSSTRTEQQVDEHGNVIKKSQTYTSDDLVTGDASSSFSTTVESPDGSTSTVEQQRTTDGSYGGTTLVEKRTTTTTVD